MVHLRKQKHWLPLLKGHQPYAHITREGSIVEQAGLEQTAAFASGCGACQIFDLFPQEEHLSLAKKVSLCVYKKSVFSGRIPLKNGESCLYYLVPVKKHPLKAKACLYLVREASHLEQDERLKAIGKVTAGVAHDLNNIFTGILSMVQLLKWQTSDAKLLKIEESIEASLERAASITRHITYSLKEETAAAICPTNALLGAIDLLKSCLGSQIALIEEIDMRQGCLVEMPASELIQLVLNLVLNAKDAMEGSGRIILKAGYHPAKAPSHFFLSVQDFGKGIEENAPLFAPFYTTKEEKNSIGFGLFIIKSIIEKRNGSISIQSKEGSTFHLTFPLKLNMALHHA